MAFRVKPIVKEHLRHVQQGEGRQVVAGLVYVGETKADRPSVVGQRLVALLKVP